ncbi:MAG TPA: matrixin family metalloprotease [Polyangia bacterium]|nr:matrixin family metalloprotease [Polyangia bacterium]
MPAAVLLAVSWVAAERQAGAYVREQIVLGPPFVAGPPAAWARSCIPILVFTDGLTDLTAEQVMRAATAAAATWSGAANPCTAMRLEVTRASGPGPGAQVDGASTVTFHRTDWCTSSSGSCPPNDPPQPSMTSVFVRVTTGEIVEGDVEINARDFGWTDLDLAPGTLDRQDLQNVLTHEFGHLLGLAHSCWSATEDVIHPLDDTGQPAPACDQASAAVRDTSMFASLPVGETKKRTLASDDQNALCTIYPADGGSPGADGDLTTCTPPPMDAGTDLRDGAGDPVAEAGPPDVGDVAADVRSGKPAGSGTGCGCALAEPRSAGWATVGAALALLACRRGRRAGGLNDPRARALGNRERR